MADASPATQTPGTYTAGGVTYAEPRAVTASGTAVHASTALGRRDRPARRSPTRSSTPRSLVQDDDHATAAGSSASATRRPATSANYDRHVYMTNTGQLVFGATRADKFTVTTPRQLQRRQLAPGRGDPGQRRHAPLRRRPAGRDQHRDHGAGLHRLLARRRRQDVAGSSSTLLRRHHRRGGGLPGRARRRPVLAHYNASPARGNQRPADRLDRDADVHVPAVLLRRLRLRATPTASIASYAWNFGDGTTGAGATPTHAYAAAGTYTVALTVTDDPGRPHDHARRHGHRRRTSRRPPRSPQSCTKLDCTFDASGSSDTDGTVTSYAWDFGDGIDRHRVDHDRTPTPPPATTRSP